MGLWDTYWEPTLTLLLFSVTLCRRCFCSLPGPSYLHPSWTPSVLLGDKGRTQHFETSPPPSDGIGIGWWTENLLGTDTSRQCDCTSFISLENQAKRAGVCQ